MFLHQLVDLPEIAATVSRLQHRVIDDKASTMLVRLPADFAKGAPQICEQGYDRQKLILYVEGASIGGPCKSGIAAEQLT